MPKHRCTAIVPLLLAGAGALRLPSGSRAREESPLNVSRSGVVYKHLAKTGGWYINHLLRKSLEHDSVRLLREEDGLAPLRQAWGSGPRPFVIGSMRNPCDYYVSMWAYNSMGNGLSSRTEPALAENLGQDTNSSFGSGEDVHRFRRWLRALPAPRFNYESIRFWLNYYSLSPRQYKDCRYHRGCVKDSGMESAMLKDLEPQLSPTGVDCWVLTESAPADLRACLERYVREKNGVVDFSFFEAKKRPTKHRHQSLHQPCEHYYDQDTASFVQSRDRAVIDGFGFRTCCSENGLPWNASGLDNSTSRAEP